MGEEIDRLSGIILQLLAQPVDEHTEVLAVLRTLGSPERGEELGVGDGLVGLLHEHMEGAALERRQRDFGAGLEDAMTGEIERQVAAHQALSGDRGLEAIAADGRAQARPEGSLGDDWPHHEVVRSGIEDRHSIGKMIVSGEHEEWQLGVEIANLAAGRGVFRTQGRTVQQNYVVVAGTQAGQGFGEIRGFPEREAIWFEDVVERGKQRGGVSYDKNITRIGAHTCDLRQGCWSAIAIGDRGIWGRQELACPRIRTGEFARVQLRSTEQQLRST
jgi:hypothetical protein